MLTFSTIVLLTHILSKVVASETSFAVAGVQAHLTVAGAGHTSMLQVVVTWRTVVSALSMMQKTFHPSSVCVANKREKVVGHRGHLGYKKELYEAPVLQLDSDC